MPIQTTKDTLTNEQRMVEEIDPETKAECDKVLSWIEVATTKDLGLLYVKKPPLFSKITRRYRWTMVLRKWLLSRTKSGRLFLAFEFNWDLEQQKRYIKIHSQKLIK